MKQIHVEPLTRVEGHGRVELQVDGQQLLAVRIELAEPTRLFEALVRGRNWQEVPALVCRICSICSSVHRIAAATALEAALQLDIPPAACYLRELLQLGGHIESHALHLFALILPDLTGTASLLELLRQDLPAAHRGVALKQFGNTLQGEIGGRIIHPITVEVGGMTRLPERAVLQRLRASAEQWREQLPELLAPFLQAQDYPAGTAAIGTRLAVVRTGEFGLSGDVLQVGERQVNIADYRALLAEAESDSTAAKISVGADGPFLTGALARQELQRQLAPWSTMSVRGIHGNNAAQALELVWALERVCWLLQQLEALPATAPLAVAVQPRAGVGTAAFESPRGLLVHRYVLDGNGRVAQADIVTPTAINQLAMEAQLTADLQLAAAPEDFPLLAERIVRAYDPCISCAVHLLRC